MIILVGILYCGLGYSQYNTLTKTFNINEISGSDTSWTTPFVLNSAWSVDIITDTTNITSGTSGSIDIQQSNDEVGRMAETDLLFSSLNIYQLPATLDSLSEIITIKDEDWSGGIINFKINVGTLSGDIEIKFIFKWNELFIKP